MRISVLSRVESVQSFPHSPRVEQVDEPISAIYARMVIAQSTRALRVIEAGRAPIYFFPMEDVMVKNLVPSFSASIEESIGVAQYYSLKYHDEFIPNVGWCFPNPSEDYSELKNHFSFFPHKLTECYVGSELVDQEKSKQYGGWCTANIIGPFQHKETH